MGGGTRKRERERKTLIMTPCGKNKSRATAAAKTCLKRKPREGDAVKQSTGHVNCPLNALGM